MVAVKSKKSNLQIYFNRRRVITVGEVISHPFSHFEKTEKFY